MFRPHPSVGASPSSDAAGNTYVWVGTTGSAWDAPGDWNDTTTGTTGISAPGRGDVATITGAVGPGASPLLVVGGGEAAALTVVGPVSLEGNYQLGSLIVGGSLELGPPPQQTGTAAVSVERLQLRIGSILSLYQADLSVAGSSIVFGNIDLSTGSSLQAGNLKLVRSSPYNGGPGIEVDATSTVEIGHAGGAEAGSITIDKGFSLSAGFLEGTVVDNGSLVVNGRMGITSFFGSDTLTGYLLNPVRGRISPAGSF